MDHWQRQKEAAAKVAEMMKRPLLDELYSDSDFSSPFDPWELTPIYGTYSSDFDDCAIDVLEEIRDKRKVRDDLGAEMFREMLCRMELCDYGTSPRVCFSTPDFAEILPAFIEKWKAFSAQHWRKS